MRRFVAISMLVAALFAAVLLPFTEMNRATAPPSIDKALFAPSQFPVGNWTPKDLNYTDVYFVSEDNVRLHGWYCPVETPKATILIAHGNAGNLATRVSLLRHLQSTTNASVFIFDYRGYGRSEGTPNIESALRDARTARTTLCELASVNESEILLMGESLGGAIMVDLAAESAPRALILQSTFSTLKDMANVHYPQYASMVPDNTLDSVTQIAKFNGLLFQSHGESDATIPISLGRKVFSAALGRKVFASIPDANHNNWLTNDYLDQLDEFVDGISAGD